MGDRMRPPLHQQKLKTAWVPCHGANCREEVWIVSGTGERALCSKHLSFREARAEKRT